MDSESAKIIEAQFKRRFKEAERLMAERRYEAALEVLDELERDFPHRKALIYTRNRCLTALGRSAIADIKDDKRKHATVFDGDAEWHDEKVFPNLKIRPRKGIVAPIWEPRDYEDEEEIGHRSSEVLYWLVAAGFALILLTGAFRAVYGERLAGARETFADMPFVWIPDEYRPANPEEAEAEPGVWMARHELTQEEWKAIMLSGPDPFNWKDDETIENRPVENVDRDMIVAYLEQLNLKGQGYFRLPTEDEWERASRAGAESGSPYFYGDSEGALRRYAWYRDSQPPTRGTWTVARRRPNPWGLYDVYGNVAEWCLEVPPSEQRTMEQSGPLVTRALRWVARGGHVLSSADAASSMGREAQTDTRPDIYTGLRLVREPGPNVDVDVRVLKFPDDRSLGMLYRHEGGEWREFISARGEVIVQAGQPLRLVVSADGVSDLSPLSELEPDALAEIHMNGLDASDEQLAPLRHLTLLRGLDIAGNPRLTDLGIANLNSLTALEELTADRTGMTGEGIRHLWGMRLLRRLSLVGLSRIHGAHVETVGRLNSLRTLDVTGTSLAQEDLGELQLLLPYCEITPAPPPPTPSQALRWASVRGKYGMLVEQFRAEREDPLLEALRAKERGQTFFLERGYDTQSAYGRFTGLEPGYWVFVEPYWYVWHETTDALRRRSRDWGPERATGAPDAQPASQGESPRPLLLEDGTTLAPEDLDLLDPRRYWGRHEPGNVRAAWAPELHEEQADWLLLEFPEPARPIRVELFSAAPLPAFEALWFYDTKGLRSPPIDLPQAAPSGRGALYALELNADTRRFFNDTETARIRLSVFRPALTGASDDAIEIDAVAMIDDEGTRHWARFAHASSYLGETIDQLNALGIDSEERIIYPDDIQFRGFFHMFTELVKDNPSVAHPEWIQSLRERDERMAALFQSLRGR